MNINYTQTLSLEDIAKLKIKLEDPLRLTTYFKNHKCDSKLRITFSFMSPGRLLVKNEQQSYFTVAMGDKSYISLDHCFSRVDNIEKEDTLLVDTLNISEGRYRMVESGHIRVFDYNSDFSKDLLEHLSGKGRLAVIVDKENIDHVFILGNVGRGQIRRYFAVKNN
jgi:hypothetical protein